MDSGFGSVAGSTASIAWPTAATRSSTTRLGARSCPAASRRRSRVAGSSSTPSTPWPRSSCSVRRTRTPAPSAPTISPPGGAARSGRCVRRPAGSRSRRCCATCSTCWRPAPSCTRLRPPTIAASASSGGRAARRRPSERSGRSSDPRAPRSRPTGGSAAMPDRRSVPDQAARDLIRRRLDVNLLVEAGAGSGKTECLARRMAAGVLDGTYAVDQIAAVTFTRKAAAELRGRFQLALEKAVAAERDAARKERALQALRHLERLFAGTIHAFCAHLLRERPVEAGVAPGFTELDEIAQLDQQRRAWRDYLDRQRALGSSVLRELVDAGVKPSDLDHAFQTVCTHADVAFPAGDASRPDPTPARAALEQFWERLEALLPGPIDPDTTCPVQRAMRKFRRRFRVAALAEPRVVAELAAEWDGSPRITQNRWAASGRDRQAVKAKIEALFAELQEVTLPFL